MNLQDHILMWQHADLQITDVRRTVVVQEAGPLRYRFPSACFLYVIRGGAALHLDDVTYTAKPYSLLHAGKGTQLVMMPTESGIEYYMLLYKASAKLPVGWSVRQPTPPENPFCFQYGFEPLYPLPLLHAVRNMEDVWSRATPLGRFQVKSLFYQFIHELLHQLDKQGAKMIVPDAVEHALKYLETRYAETITLETLAKELDYSVSHLSALFKSRTGASPIDFLLRLRMEKAAELLLTTNVSLREVAEFVGYGDVYYFGRLFKKHWGTSPARYRTAQGKRRQSEVRPWAAIRSSIVLRGGNRYIGNESENHYHNKGVEKRSMNQRRKKVTISLALCLMLLLSACGTTAGGSNTASPSSPASTESSAPSASPTASAAPAAKNVTDDFGHPLTYSSNPERILAPYMEDALVTLGVTPVAKYAVGDTVQEHLEPWLGDLPTIDFAGGLSPEVVLGFEPDLIMISSHFLPVEKYDTIAKVAPTYLFQSGDGSWSDQLRKVADLLDKTEVAEQKLAEYDAKLAEVKSELAQAAADKTIAIIWPTEKEFYVVGSDFLSGKLIFGDLGLTPHTLANVTKDNFGLMSLEKLPDLDADELFVITPEGQTEEQVRTMLNGMALWPSLPAVTNNRVHHVASGHWINAAYMANLAVIEDVSKALLES